MKKLGKPPARPRRAPPWTVLSRRRFLGGLAASAALLVVEIAPAAPEPVPPARKRTIWIGHC